MVTAAIASFQFTGYIEKAGDIITSVGNIYNEFVSPILGDAKNGLFLFYYLLFSIDLFDSVTSILTKTITEIVGFVAPPDGTPDPTKPTLTEILDDATTLLETLPNTIDEITEFVSFLLSHLLNCLFRWAYGLSPCNRSNKIFCLFR